MVPLDKLLSETADTVAIASALWGLSHYMFHRIHKHQHHKPVEPERPGWTLDSFSRANDID
jgi:hypothetical protein